jgi:hypothetical protein
MKFVEYKQQLWTLCHVSDFNVSPIGDYKHVKTIFPKKTNLTVRSGDIGGHGVGPPMSVHVPSEQLFRNCITLRWKFGEVPSSWEKNVLPRSS